MIEHRNSKNPIVISGDFNTSIYYFQECAKTLEDEIYGDLGFKDAWFEIHNEGEYTLESLQEWVDMYGGYSYSYTKDKWNSIEKILFKDGENVKLTATSFEYKMFSNSEGKGYSDHPATVASFTYEIIEEIADNDEQLVISQYTLLERILKFFKGFMNALTLILTNLDTI